jgi:hypothetical protein
LPIAVAVNLKIVCVIRSAFRLALNRIST